MLLQKIIIQLSGLYLITLFLSELVKIIEIDRHYKLALLRDKFIPVDQDSLYLII